MKIRMMFKDPDTVFEAIRDAVKESVDALNLNEREAKLLCEARLETVSNELGKWIEFGEYVTVEFDTEAKTAVVCEVER